MNLFLLFVLIEALERNTLSYVCPLIDQSIVYNNAARFSCGK